MPIAPELDRSTARALRTVNHAIYAKWDRKREMWEIGLDNHITMPHIIMYVMHPITDRNIEALRRAHWISSHGVARWANEQMEKYYAHNAKSDANLEDWSNDFGKRLGPLAASLADAGTSSHGKSVNMFPGHGESTVFGGDGA